VETGPEISIAAPSGSGHVRYLREHLVAAWRLLEAGGERPPEMLSVAIVPDETMAELHEEVLAISGPTDRPAA